MAGTPATSIRETGLTALFVRRPVLAFVLNTLIVVAGLAAFYGVEIRELPDVDRPVITVTTDFHGAAAETVDRELTAVIEGAVSRVSGVKSISSTLVLRPQPRHRRVQRRRRSRRRRLRHARRGRPRRRTSCPTTPTRRASSRPTPTPTRSCGSPSPPTRCRSRT